MTLSKVLRSAREQQDVLLRESIQVVTGRIPCTYETCYNWKAGQCGNKLKALSNRKPPEFCDCDIRLRNYKYGLGHDSFQDLTGLL